MRAVGIEPTLLSELDFESGAAGGGTYGKLPILFVDSVDARNSVISSETAEEFVKAGPSPVRTIRKGARGDPLPDR